VAASGNSGNIGAGGWAVGCVDGGSRHPLPSICHAVSRHRRAGGGLDVCWQAVGRMFGRHVGEGCVMEKRARTHAVCRRGGALRTMLRRPPCDLCCTLIRRAAATRCVVALPRIGGKGEHRCWRHAESLLRSRRLWGDEGVGRMWPCWAYYRAWCWAIVLGIYVGGVAGWRVEESRGCLRMRVQCVAVGARCTTQEICSPRRVTA